MCPDLEHSVAPSVPLWTLEGGQLNGLIACWNQGWSVSLSSDGNTVVVGAPMSDLPDKGCEHVCEWNGADWQQRGEDLQSEADGDRLGWSVSLSSDGSTVAWSSLQ